MKKIVQLKTTTQALKLLGLEKPKHPLVAVASNACINMEIGELRLCADFYFISLKDGMTGKMKYGRSSYDFEEGTMVFVAPGQVYAAGEVKIEPESKGWTLLVHPDLIRKSELGREIDNYSFFSYDVNEALHLSEDEKQTLTDLVEKIQKELNQNIDSHTQHLIVANIKLLLDYCRRYYDRQFYTRTNANRDIISRFETLLKEYYSKALHVEMGVPTVKYCGKELGISANYLSDLLKKETGRNAREHIHSFIIDRAKNELLGSSQPISRIALDLGFEYPPHFTKLFKNNTGLTPSEFRKLN